MAVIYFDDVKFEGGVQPAFWLGGIYVPEDKLLVINKQMGDLAEQYFGTRELTKETEFHANHISNRAKAFKGWDHHKAIRLLKQLADIFAQPELLKTFWVRIQPPSGTHSSDSKTKLIALVNLLKIVDELCRETNVAALVIGDAEDRSILRKFEQLALSLQVTNPTDDYIPKINNIVDTVYFTASKNSRFLQLADVLVWFSQLLAQPNSKNKIKQKLIKHARTVARLASPDKVFSLDRRLGWTLADEQFIANFEID